MNFLWHSLDCKNCKNKEKIIYGPLGVAIAWDCGARKQRIKNNKFFKGLENCWYFEKR